MLTILQAHAIEGAHRRARRLGEDNFLEPWLFDHNFAELGRGSLLVSPVS